MRKIQENIQPEFTAKVSSIPVDELEAVAHQMIYHDVPTKNGKRVRFANGEITIGSPYL